MQPKNGDHNDDKAGFFQRAQSSGERRHRRQRNAQIRYEAEKTADDSQEIEIRQAQKSEYSHADHAHEHADHDVASNETSYHERDLSHRDIRRSPVFRRK